MRFLKMYARSLDVAYETHTKAVSMCFHIFRAEQDMFQYKQFVQRSWQGATIHRLLVVDMDRDENVVFGEAVLWKLSPSTHDSYGAVFLRWTAEWLSEVFDLSMWKNTNGDDDTLVQLGE